MKTVIVISSGLASSTQMRLVTRLRGEHGSNIIVVMDDIRENDSATSPVLDLSIETETQRFIREERVRALLERGRPHHIKHRRAGHQHVSRFGSRRAPVRPRIVRRILPE